MFSMWNYIHPGLNLCNSKSHHIAVQRPHGRTLHPATEDLGLVQTLTSKTKFSVKLNTRGYSLDEIEVKVENGFLLITGETGETGGVDFKTWRKFTRRFPLPDNCIVDKLRCELGGIREDDSILKVIIPRKEGGKATLFDKLRATHPVTPSCPTYRAHPMDFEKLAANGYWVSGVECKKDSFVLRLQASQFSPEEIFVNVLDDYLVVRGEQEDKEEGEGFVSCSFKRRYRLPNNVVKDRMICDINGDGVLEVVLQRWDHSTNNTHVRQLFSGSPTPD